MAGISTYSGGSWFTMVYPKTTELISLALIAEVACFAIAIEEQISTIDISYRYSQYSSKYYVEHIHWWHCSS